MYKSDIHTPRLFPDFFHLGTRLDHDNRWLKLAGAIPWARLDELYARHFSDTGRPAVNSRLVCGLLIVKQVRNLSDDDAVAELMENPYIQSFCGLENFAVEPPLSPSLLSERRKRLGEDFFEFLEKDVARILREQRFVRYRQQGGGFLARLLDKLRDLVS